MLTWARNSYRTFLPKRDFVPLAKVTRCFPQRHIEIGGLRKNTVSSVTVYAGHDIMEDHFNVLIII